MTLFDDRNTRKELEGKVLEEYSVDEVRRYLEYLATPIRRARTEIQRNQFISHGAQPDTKANPFLESGKIWAGPSGIQIQADPHALTIRENDCDEQQ